MKPQRQSYNMPDLFWLGKNNFIGQSSAKECDRPLTEHEKGAPQGHRN